jgi:membrane-associated protease RseP (regulator of RpoE activity)
VSEPRAALSSALIAGLIVAAGVVTWSALAVYRRPAVESTATIDPGAGTVAPPAAISDTPAPPPPVSTVAVNATAAVVDTAQQDQRQAAKITRGLAANPSGGILVETAPSGTVASQLRLEAGDVIVSVNGRPVRSPEEFARIYREQGLPRQMTVIHNGSETHHH